MDWQCDKYEFVVIAFEMNQSNKPKQRTWLFGFCAYSKYKGNCCKFYDIYNKHWFYLFHFVSEEGKCFYFFII